MVKCVGVEIGEYFNVESLVSKSVLCLFILNLNSIEGYLNGVNGQRFKVCNFIVFYLKWKMCFIKSKI